MSLGEFQLPLSQPWSMPFWAGLEEDRFLLQHCEACGKSIFYPRPACPYCGGDQLLWREAEGSGTVYSYTVVRNNAPTAFKDSLPFVLAIVQLSEGPRLLTHIVDCAPEDVRCDMPVTLTFGKAPGGQVLPFFRPREVV